MKLCSIFKILVFILLNKISFATFFLDFMLINFFFHRKIKCYKLFYGSLRFYTFLSLVNDDVAVILTQIFVKFFFLNQKLL